MEKGNVTSKTTGWKSTAGWCFVRQVRGLSVKPADRNMQIHSKNGIETFTTDGVNNWKEGARILAEHNNSAFHRAETAR